MNPYTLHFARTRRPVSRESAVARYTATAFKHLLARQGTQLEDSTTNQTLVRRAFVTLPKHGNEGSEMYADKITQ